MILVMSALWMVSFMLVLNRSLLNGKYILIDVLKALASIISIRNLHVTFLSKITPRYFRLNCQVIIDFSLYSLWSDHTETHPLPNNGCTLLLRIRCRGMLLSRCLAMGLYVTVPIEVW
jgi:hypothetical protein